MSKVLYAAVLVAAVAAVALTPGCKGSKKKDTETACSACGCGAGCAAEACAGGCSACGGEEACGGCSACGGCEACGGCSACGCGGCGGGGGGEIDAKDAKQALTLFKIYSKSRSWTKTAEEPWLSKQHMRHYVVNFVNGIGKDTYMSGQGTFPVNAAVAKHGTKDGEHKVTWLMQKRKAGYDSENGDWWYAMVSADGMVMAAGRNMACANCHSGADNDYVFGNPK